MRARLVWAGVILAMAGFVGASALVAVARAQDPDPTPTTTVAPPAEPTPDPAPPVAPAPKPKPKPAPPRPARQRATVTPPQTPQVVQPEPSTPSTPRVVQPKRKPKPKRVVRPKVRVERKSAVASAEIATLKPVGVLRSTPDAAPDDPFDFAAALIISTLALAIVCFGVTSIPRTLLPRRAAYFVVDYQVELVVLGSGLFALTLLTFLWSGGG